MMIQDTIAAIATPIGEGAIALVRMSGPDALGIAKRIFHRGMSASIVPVYDLEPNRAYFGRIIENNELIDEVVLTFFKAPRSYTKEDVIEISCHGGYRVASRILTATLHGSARPAEPGEFTRRAFLNGRIDLTQAEAVSELIAANSEMARKSAVRQLQGSLRKTIEQLRSSLISCLAVIEASIDFAEEDISNEEIDQLLHNIRSISVSLENIKYTAGFSQKVRDGFRIPIVGLPNVGKSSLLNALLSKERSIVSPIAGTTRDTIEEVISVDGISLRLIDTAGIREVDEHIEIQGVERAKKAIEEADVILMVLEAGHPLTIHEQQLLESKDSTRLIVALNKSDLTTEHRLLDELKPMSSCLVSAKTGRGIPELKHIITSRIKCGASMNCEVEFLANSRHQDAVRRASQCLASAIASMSSKQPIEIVASDLQLACNSLDEIIGTITNEDVLDAVFSKFCIGK